MFGSRYDCSLGHMAGGQSFTALRVRALDARALPEQAIKAWSALEERALEPNAYLSPHFVLPALRYLDPDLRAWALLVEAPQRGSDAPGRLVGVAVCRGVPGSRTFPLPHLVAYRSRHSFLSGVLLDRDYAEDALRALLHYVRTQVPRCHGMEFGMLWGDGPTHALLRTAGRPLGMEPREWNRCERAVLYPRRDRAMVEAQVATEMHGLRRRIRRLSEMGEVRAALVGLRGLPEQSAEVFLDLEYRGWKGEKGTSLRSTLAAESFFRAVVSGMAAEGRALFAELSVGGKVIASSSNFVSGNAGFAFKIGWAPDLAKLSPGLQVELALMQQITTHEALQPLEFWDSGSQAGSYIEKLWPGRRPLVSAAVGTSWAGRRVLDLVGTARVVRREYASVSRRWARSSKPD